MVRRPYYRKSLKAFYVLHKGRQVRLGRTKKDADKAWKRLLAESEETPDLPAQQLIQQFLDWCRENRSPATLCIYRRFLDTFRESVGTIRAADVRPLHVTKWLTSRRYKDTTGNCAVRAVCRCFSWADRQGILRPNPLTGVDRPAASPREVYLTADQWAAVLAAVGEGDSFRLLLAFLWETGCRPQETRAAESRHFDPVARTVTFPRKESKGKRRQRIIVLNSAAFAIVQQLSQANPDNPIFGSSGNSVVQFPVGLR